MLPAIPEGFSPRNGEVILKTVLNYNQLVSERFQSPQWGSNSKGSHFFIVRKTPEFQSPQWGSNSKASASYNVIP